MSRCLMLSMLLLAIPPSAAVAQDQVDLPVTRAVLFSSGVGYFEHVGEVQGDATLSLKFKTEQINDVLKSMVFMDQDGGTVSSITYASNEPVQRALQSFGIDLSGDPTLPDLLQQLRGARVLVQAPDKIEGSILNVQARQVVAGDPPVTTTEHLLTLVTPTGLRTIPLDTIESLQFVDPKLQGELTKALEFLVASRDTERKPVDLHFAGEGRRRVRVAYLVETPVWKTSYRLDLSPLAQEKKKPLLQGWAIVENTSDSDWDDVQLSLVSGRPISFVMDLYTPLYLERPVVRPMLMASLRPRIHEEGIAESKRARKLEAQAAPDALALRRQAAAAPMSVSLPPAAEAADAADVAFDLGASFRSAASAGSVGELFRFTLHEPVDMPRRRSAMIPIINQEVQAEKVSIYNQAVQAKHPLNGVVLTNDTGLKMLAGPVTVFDGASYAGDAQIDHLAPGDERLLSYAVDLAVTVDPSVKSSTRIVSAKIVRGVLSVQQRHVWDQTYRIRNKADAKRMLIVEHPFVNGRTLLDPKEFQEKTAALYRFRVPLGADTTGEFTVKEEQIASQSIAILSTDVGQLLYYRNTGQIPQEVRDALGRAVQLKQDLERLQQQVQEHQQDLKQLEDGQDRLRKNLQTVGQASQLGKRYLAKLSEEEDRIEQLEKQITSLRKDLEAKENELAEYLKNLDVG